MEVTIDITQGGCVNRTKRQTIRKRILDNGNLRKVYLKRGLKTSL